MLWAGSEAHAYISPNGASIRIPGETAVVRLDASNFADATAAAFEIVKSHSSGVKRVRLWLGGGTARPFILASVPGLRDRSEAINVAKAQVSQHTDLDVPCHVWLDAWQAERDCLAVAVEQSLLDTAISQSACRSLRICAISPSWNAVLTQALHANPPAMIAIQETGALTLLKLSGGSVERATFANPSLNRVVAHIRRSAIGWATPLEEVLQADIQGLLPDLKAESGGRYHSNAFSIKWRRWTDHETSVN